MAAHQLAQQNIGIVNGPMNLPVMAECLAV